MRSLSLGNPQRNQAYAVWGSVQTNFSSSKKLCLQTFVPTQSNIIWSCPVSIKYVCAQGPGSLIWNMNSVVLWCKSIVIKWLLIITFQGYKILPHTIIQHCASFWQPMILQTLYKLFKPFLQNWILLSHLYPAKHAHTNPTYSCF